MRRKIVKLAEKTLVVSMPSKWLESNNLTKGDEVDLSMDDHRIVITPPIKKDYVNVVTIDVKNVSERVLRWEISSLHKQGYDEIVVLNYNDAQHKIISELIKDLFIGFIIKEKSSLRIVIGQVALVDPEEFDATLRRTFRLLVVMVEETMTAFSSKDEDLLARQVDNEHINNQLTNFCERLLNKSLKMKDKGHFWYVIAWNLEKVADNFKYIAEHYKGNLDVSEDAVSLLGEVVMYLKQYNDCFYDFSFDALVSVNEFRNHLLKTCRNLMIECDKNDVMLLHFIDSVIMQTADFSASMIALRHNT